MKSATLLRALEDPFYKKTTGKQHKAHLMRFRERGPGIWISLNAFCVLFLLKFQCITSPRFYVNAGLRVNASLTVGFPCHIYRIKASPGFQPKDTETRWLQTFQHKLIAMLPSMFWWRCTRQSSLCIARVKRNSEILLLFQKRKPQKSNTVSEWSSKWSWKEMRFLSIE